MLTTIQPKAKKLLPVFLKPDNMHMLLVGGDDIALDQLKNLLQYSAHITLVAHELADEVKSLCIEHKITFHERKFLPEDVEQKDMVIIAIADNLTASYIRLLAKAQNLWVYAPHNTALSDVEIGSAFQQGNITVGLSASNTSPDNLNQFFAELNTAGHAIQHKKHSSQHTDKDNYIIHANWKKIVTYSVGGFALMLIGHFIFSYIPLKEWATASFDWYSTLDKNFHWMILAGFLAQLVDGALGMGYGVTSTTILLSTGVNPAAISGSIHTAEIFASGASGYSHYRFGNVNKKLFKALLIPGVIGAILGAILLVQLGESHIAYIRPVLAGYTMFLGIRILLTAFRKQHQQKKFKRHGWLAGIGGFLDSFGGGGWGPIVTTTLITKGRSPKYVIGSVSITEFFVTLASAFTFFTCLGVTHWQVIAALIIGGLVAAPLAARLTGKLPKKASFILLGILVILWSLKILISIF